MRLTSIRARELLSFDCLELEELVGGRVAVVGPNGSGKTNLIRLLEFAQAAIDRAATNSAPAVRALTRFAAARRLGSASNAVSSVRLGISLTEDFEHELLLNFVRAAVASSILRDAPSNFDVSGALAWISKSISVGDVGPLADGEFVAELTDETIGQWSMGYEFQFAGEAFRWVIDGVFSPGAIVRLQDAGTPGVPTNALAQQLNLDEKRVPGEPFTFGTLLPSKGAATLVLLEARPLPSNEFVRAFAAGAGIPMQHTQNRSFTMAEVLRVVLGRGLVLLGDLREPPRTEYNMDEAGYEPSPADGSQLPLRLFRLKNGSPESRARYSSTKELFARLTGRAFEITLAQWTTTRGEESTTSLQISAVVDRRADDLPVELAGAGFWEALLLSATLADSAGRVVFLDEPARNLHPTSQRRLLAEMRSAAGQVLLTTHSPYMVPFEDDTDLAAIVRLDLVDGATRVRRLVRRAPGDGARLRKALAESADARSLLFARGVVLVEGGTELGALPVWFAGSGTASRSETPDALNLVLFSVNGDRNFELFVSFLHGLGIPWAIVCDGNAFRFDSGGRQIFDQVLRAGVDDPEFRGVVDNAVAHSPTSFTALRELGCGHGVFTLANGWEPPQESFEAYVESVAPGKLAEAANLVGTSKPRKGRHVASTVDCPPEVDALYATLLQRLGAD